MKTKRNAVRAFLVGLALIVFGTAPGTAPAQQRAAALEEIVVSARRVEESLQDVPVSVAAFTGDDLALRGPHGTLFGRNSNGGAIQMITKRPAEEFGGRIRAEIGNFNQQTLSASLDVPFSDTLKSKFTVGQLSQDGQICSLIVPACYGGRNDDLLRADFVWTPNDNVDLRVAYDNQTTVSSDRKQALIVYPLHQRIVGLNIAARNPAFRGEFLPISEYSPRTHNPGFPGGEVGEWETKSDGPEDGIRTDYEALTATLNWDITDNISLESISAIWKKNGDYYRDIRGAEVIEGVEDETFSSDTVVSQEFHLTGSSFGDRVAWLGGLWYQDSQEWDALYRWNVPWAVLPDGPDANCTPDVNLEIRDWVRDPANWGEYADLPVYGFPPGGSLATWSPIGAPSAWCFGNPLRNSTQDYALFGEAGIGLTDRMNLTFGVRWSDRDHTLYRYSRRGIPGTAVKPDTPGPIVGDIWAANLVSSAPELPTSVWFTPKVSLDYQWTDDVMIYTSYAEGFTAGQVNLSGDDYTETDPEIVGTIEFGIHSYWMDRTLRFNGSVFFTDWQNIRTEVAPVDPEGGIFLTAHIVTGGNAEASGLDAEVIWQPTDRFLLTTALGLLDTKYVELVPGIPVDEDQPFAYAPELSYNPDAQYDWPMAET